MKVQGFRFLKLRDLLFFFILPFTLSFMVILGTFNVVSTTIISINSINSVEYVRITVLIDNNPYGSYNAPWGVSMLVETPQNKIIFDAGPNKDDLEANAISMGVDIDDIDFIIISHEHWDHVDGLNYFNNDSNTRIQPNLKVYVPTGMDRGTKTTIEFLGFNITEIEATTNLGNGLAIIGQLYGPPYEHALAVNVTGVGLVILVGCRSRCR
jgi:7,8-dihydropterin-6-yl-methyl-4-(beta-D-ribofuranosyl)aminobenzene 5'-phosphate synthase